MNRSYSRRELYALGEPLGDSATYRKAGGLVLGDGGGGGGSAPAPDKTTQVSELPEWARPYAKDTLAKGAALTDINQNPYQTYGGNRIAGFSPLQQMSFQGAANMQPSQQVGMGSDLAAAAGIGALGTNYQAGRFGGGMFGQGAADFYMNPYQQNVTDIGKREAARQSAIQGTQQQAQATQAGAFGGGRDAIMRAERERNLGQQMSDIQAQGSNAAFQQAQQQFNADQARRMQAQQLGEQSRQYGAGLGMQGLQTALQGAGQLGALGGQQFQQGMDINKLQSAYGGQMQQQAQRPLDMAYQDFQNQQNYPYKQLGFMSDMIRGLPLGQQSTSSIYEQGPGMTQTLAGLGGAAYGFGKSGLFGKEGGLMTSYADGGEVKRYAGNEGSVTSQDNKDNIVGGMYSMEGLQKAKEAALARRDIDTANAIDERIVELNAIQAQSASIDRGLGSAFNQIPEDRQETMMAANGGIVAFAPGGTTYSKRLEKSLTDLKEMANKAPVEPTPEQRDEAISARIPMLEKRYGPDITQPYLEETKAKREKLPEQMEKDQGLAIAMASLGLLARKKRPGESKNQQLIAGLGEAGLQFAGEVGKLKKESREADDKLRQSEILLATAQQSRKEGLINKADAEETRAQDLKRDGFKTQVNVQEKITQLESGLANTEMQGENALRTANVSAAGQLAAAKLTSSKPSAQMEGVAIKADEIRRQFPDMPESQVRDKALQAYLSESGKYPSADRAADARATFYEKISSNVDDRLVMDKKYKALQKEDKKTGGTAADQYREQLIAIEMDKARSQNQPAPGATAQPAPAQQQPAPVVKPSLNEFLNAARKANPGVSDADLEKYYNSKYGK
jgi:hypothetical protein